YTFNSDVDDKYQELVREIGIIRSELPQDIYSLEIMKADPTDVNVLQLALISENASMASLKREAENLQEELEKIPQLKKVAIHGPGSQLVRVDVQPDRLASMQIPLSRVMQAIQREAVNIPG